MKLFALSGTCSLAPHILLRLVGAPFELVLLNRAAGELKAPGYLAINPRGKVPALEVGGRVIVENVAIQFYLATCFREHNLAPPDLIGRANWLSFLTWCSSSVHPSFRRFMRPELYTPDEEAWPSLREAGRQEFLSALNEMDARLAASAWMLGDAFSTADAYGHVFHLWARRMEFEIDHLNNLKRHGRAMIGLPAVQEAFQDEMLPQSLFD